MQAELAAAYLSLSTSTFRAQVVPDVPPVSLTPGRVGWMREDLDKWLADRAGRDPEAITYNPWRDLDVAAPPPDKPSRRRTAKLG